jgi:hypothetical protein
MNNTDSASKHVYSIIPGQKMEKVPGNLNNPA